MLIVLLSFLASALALLQPWPMKILVDHVLDGREVPWAIAFLFGGFSESARPAIMIGALAVASFVIFALSLFIESAATYLSTACGRRATLDVARDLFAALQRRSLRFHSSRTVGDSLTRVVTDSWCAGGVANALFLAPIPAIATVCIMTGIMLSMDVRLTAVALAVAPLMAAATVLFGRRVREVARARREVDSRVSAHVQQTLSGIQVVQAFSQEDRQDQGFSQFADQAIRAQQRTVLLKNLSGLSSGLAATLGVGAVLLFGAYQVLSGVLTVGGLLVFLSYVRTLQGKLAPLARSYTSLQALQGQVDRVLEILDAEPDVPDRPGALAVDRLTGHVRCEEVTFGYEPDHPVLHGISFEAQPGRTVAIVGASGAGKSTLVSLIPRFFDPWSGGVVIDGRDVRDYRLKSLRESISVVLQEPFLFPMSIAANIAYGRPEATPEQIEQAARAANAHGFIMQLPEGYETVIGERGATLSGGERQRISIARALLKDAPILILDEPTSAVDAQTEALLVDALRQLMRGRTTLIIAHRLSTIRQADCIIVLDAGRIVEQGTHEELLTRAGRYAALHQTAFRGTSGSPEAGVQDAETGPLNPETGERT